MPDVVTLLFCLLPALPGSRLINDHFWSEPPWSRGAVGAVLFLLSLLALFAMINFWPMTPRPDHGLSGVRLLQLAVFALTVTGMFAAGRLAFGVFGQGFARWRYYRRMRNDA